MNGLHHGGATLPSDKKETSVFIITVLSSTACLWLSSLVVNFFNLKNYFHSVMFVMLKPMVVQADPSIR